MFMSMIHRLIYALVGVAILAVTAYAQQVSKEPVAGVRNMARLETTVACAGAITNDAIPEIKKMGFASIVNLRLATEQGADVEQHQAAAKAAGLNYFHVPFAGKPDPVAADAFLKAITSPGAEPAFIHCAGGNRAATMWLIKRIAVDKWEVDKAVAEAEALGQTSVPLRQFAIEFAQSRLKNAQ
jgi:uncharacterized protein (TIGR01244 family)